MRRLRSCALVAVLLLGCSSPAKDPAPAEASAPVAEPAPAPAAPQEAQQPLDLIRGMRLRDLLPDPTGTMFLVQDDFMEIRAVWQRRDSALGAAPDIGLIAAWHGPTWAFARKQEQGKGYEIVGVGPEGSRMLASAKGYPGAMQFVGEELHFIDEEGWKAVRWGEEPVLKAKLNLGLRSNQKAWCAWLADGPRCAAGYWDGGREGDNTLSVVLSSGEKSPIEPKGEHPILADAAFSADGRMLAAVLGARSAGATDRGRVTVAWLDEAGRPTKVRDFHMLVRSLAFDAEGRLIVSRYPDNGEPRDGAQIGIVDLETGALTPVTDKLLRGSFVMAPDGRHLYLLDLYGGVDLIALPE